MTRRSLIDQLRAREAFRAVGPSTVRGQRVPGVVDACREYLASVRLREFSLVQQAAFQRHLDSHTEELRLSLPRTARRWGLSRKVLNIFLRHCLYNAYLRDWYRLERAEPLLEVPLDSLTAKGIKRHFDRGALPRWPGVRNLQPEESYLFQQAAAGLAADWGIHRVHLDAYFWVDRD